MQSFQSEAVVEETRKGAIEGAETGAMFGPVGAGWGAAFGYLNGVSRAMAAGDDGVPLTGTGRDDDRGARDE